MPKPLPDGFILTDTEKKRWRLGKIIGQGGFGLIYLASPHVDRPVPADTDFVIKVEYHENGPLFSELKFYQRAAKKESIQKWIRDKRLDFLGIPTYWGSGLAEYNDLRYRFMAMDRLGRDLQKVCDGNGGGFKPNTVLLLGHRLVDVLQYIHENEYVHADIKAANLMQGHRDPHQVYLADYGLSYRYCPEGVHKDYKENPKKGHNGTMEYTSLDAHKGVAPSRRSDLQILGFCLLHWLCGSLPWDHLLNSPVQVQEAKDRLMQNLPDSVKELSPGRVGTDEVAEFLLYVKSLDYKDTPDYQLLKCLLSCSGGDLDFSPPRGPASESTSRTEEPQPRNKRPGRGRGRAKAAADPMEVDGHFVEEEEEEQKRKPKQVPAKYIRGPPIKKPQQNEGSAFPERAARPKSKPLRFDTDDEEEEQTKLKPIPACYLRGPPVAPRAQDTQVKTKCEQVTRSVTSERRPERRQLTVKSYREDRYSRVLYEEEFLCRPGVEFDDNEDSGPSGAPVNTDRTRLQHWVLVAVVFLLVVIFLSF